VSVERLREALAMLVIAGAACTEHNPAFVPGDGSAPPGAARACPDDRELAACFRFERAARDESSSNLTVTTARSLLYEPALDGYALDVHPDTRLQIGDTTLLDATRLTIEVWLKPRTRPTAAARFGIIDYQRQYSLWVLPSGAVMCAIRGPGDLPSPPVLTPGAWSSIACVLDASAVSIWANGTMVASRAVSTVETPSGTGGMAIGSNVQSPERPNVDSFDGLIDNLRIWRRARTPTELCQGAHSCR
jgi:hypothetical protein